MSGGYLDYICFKLNDITDRIDDREIKDLIKDLSELLHDYEWWQSGDYGSETYYKTLDEFKVKWFKGDRKERLKGYIDEQIGIVRSELYSLIGEPQETEVDNG